VAKLAFIGGGGFAKEVLEIAELAGHSVAGYVADEKGELDRPYWGTTANLQQQADDFDSVFVAVGAVDRKSIDSRARLVEWVISSGFETLPLISPHAIVAASARVAPGTLVGHGVTISVDAQIGAHAILNTNAIVGHDAAIGSNVTMAPAAFVGGLVSVGDNTLLGPGSMTLQGNIIGKNVIVGVAATVLRNVADNTTVRPTKSKSSKLG